MKNNATILTLMLALMAACKDEVTPQNPPQNETELITTMQLLMKDSATGEIKRFTFKDPDGEGGQGPTTFDSISIKQGSVYDCELILLDESKTIVDTISNEVLKEADDHLVFYDITGVELQINIKDYDSKQLPLGLQSKWRVGRSGLGTVTVQLKHQPGQKDGSRAPGETDAMVSFPIKIQ